MGKFLGIILFAVVMTFLGTPILVRLVGTSDFLVTPGLAHVNQAEAEHDRARNHLVDEVGPTVFAIQITARFRKSNNPLAPAQELRGGGTGFVIAKEGLLITNAHVVRPPFPDLPEPTFIAPNKWAYADGDVAEMSFQLISIDGEKYTARIVSILPDKDLAVIAIENVQPGKVFPVAVFETDPLHYDRVVAIGGPFGMTFTITEGVISNPHRDFDGVEVVQTDAPINPGNSGGPLVILRNHKVAGVVASLLNPFNTPFNLGIAFAVPASIAKPFADESVKKYREEVSRKQGPGKLNAP